MAYKKDRTKEVLERLKSQESKPKPKLEQNYTKRPSIPKNEKSQSIYQLKLERVINRLNELERKMKHGDNYFTNYWDYSKVSEEFLDVLSEFEKFDNSFVNPELKKKLSETKLKVGNHLKRSKGTFDEKNF